MAKSESRTVPARMPYLQSHCYCYYYFFYDYYEYEYECEYEYEYEYEYDGIPASIPRHAKSCLHIQIRTKKRYYSAPHSAPSVKLTQHASRGHLHTCISTHKIVVD